MHPASCYIVSSWRTFFLKPHDLGYPKSDQDPSAPRPNHRFLQCTLHNLPSANLGKDSYFGTALAPATSTRLALRPSPSLVIGQPHCTACTINLAPRLTLLDPQATASSHAASLRSAADTRWFYVSSSVCDRHPDPHLVPACLSADCRPAPPPCHTLLHRSPPDSVEAFQTARARSRTSRCRLAACFVRALSLRVHPTFRRIHISRSD